MTLGMLERIRLILRGGSVIDWHRLGFEDAYDVRQFLRVNGVHWESPEDTNRVRDLLRTSAEYLQRELGLTVPEAIWRAEQIESPFLIASETDHPDQKEACILLKVMHTVNHMHARELRLALSLPEVEVFSRVEDHVQRALATVKADGYPIFEVEGSRKTQSSTVTKLLSKRRATAAQILDRLRFRVIVEDRMDLPLVLAELTRRLIPFNYVVPEETTNELIDFASYARSLPHLAGELDRLQFALKLEAADPLRPDINECSADTFRMLNFVIDWPLRVRDVLERPSNAHLRHLGHLIFLNVEFQMFDRVTWEANEANTAASHNAYKERQRDRVRARLFRGLEPHRLD
ncbi:MAG: hypothetical protein ACI9WU_002228 [Myxococcota bacterium]|jgi:uncharacterized protein (TIGR04552 family)